MRLPRRPRSSRPGTTATPRLPAAAPEPLLGATFRIEIEGAPPTAAVEVAFPEARLVTGRGRTAVRYGPLTLRRALTRSSDWYRWWDAARSPRGRAADTVRSVRVVLIDRFQSDAVGWTFPNAVPTAYSVSPLNALVSAPVVETIELLVGGFEARFEPFT